MEESNLRAIKIGWEGLPPDCGLLAQVRELRISRRYSEESRPDIQEANAGVPDGEYLFDRLAIAEAGCRVTADLVLTSVVGPADSAREFFERYGDVVEAGRVPLLVEERLPGGEKRSYRVPYFVLTSLDGAVRAGDMIVTGCVQGMSIGVVAPVQAGAA